MKTYLGHAGNIDGSGRLKIMYQVLNRAGKKGISGFNIQARTQCLSVSRDIDDLRKNGKTIFCINHGKNKNGRLVNKYYLVGK